MTEANIVFQVICSSDGIPLFGPVSLGQLLKLKRAVLIDEKVVINYNVPLPSVWNEVVCLVVMDMQGSPIEGSPMNFLR